MLKIQCFFCGFHNPFVHICSLSQLRQIIKTYGFPYGLCYFFCLGLMLIIIQYQYILNMFGLEKVIKNQPKTFKKSFQIPTCIQDALGDAFLDHFGVNFRPSGTKLAPSWPQVGSKLAPSRLQVRPSWP